MLHYWYAKGVILRSLHTYCLFPLEDLRKLIHDSDLNQAFPSVLV